MGLSESKLIVDVLSEACRNAENTGKIDIDAVLSKTKFVESLRQTWAYIPEKTRRSIGRRPNNNSIRRPRRKLGGPSMSKIAVPQSLMASVPRWMENSFSFFREDEKSLDLTRSPLAESYQYLGRLDCQIKMDTVRARFVKILFPRLKKRLCRRYMRSNDRETIARIISSSGIVTSSLDAIKQDVSRFTDEGRRIDTLCRDLGSVDTCRDSHLGNLFCLPDDIHDEFIRSLALNGPVREAEIQRIKSRGILDVEDRDCLDKLAANIFNSLWIRVEASIDAIIESSDSSDWSLQHTRSFRMQDGSSEQVLRPDIPAPSNEAYNGSDTNSHVHSLVSSPTYATPVSRNIQPAMPSGLDDQPLGLRMDTTTNQDLFNAQPYIQPAMPSGLDDQSLGLRIDTTTNQDFFNAQPYIQPAMPSGLDDQPLGLRMDTTTNQDLFNAQPYIQPAMPSGLDDQPLGLRMDTTTNQDLFNAQPYIQPAMPSGLDDQPLELHMDTTTNQDLFNAQPYVQPAMTSGLDIQLDPAQANEIQDTAHETNWRRKAKVYSLGMRQEFHDNAFESCPPLSQPIIIRA